MELPASGAKSTKSIGETQFSGEIFHGAFIEDPSETDSARVATEFPYRDYLIVPITHPKNKRFSDNGLTLGPGLYGTSKDEAAKYAVCRARGYGASPVLNQLTVEGKFYDFRAERDVLKNGRVAVEMAESWLQYFEANQPLIHLFVRSGVSERLTSYSALLRDFIERLKSGRKFETMEYVGKYSHLMYEYHDEMGRDVRFARGFDLRDLLRTYNTDKYGVEPVYGGLWVRFVQDELGLDGVIFNEAGEDKDFQSAPSYVIYNPQIILEQKIHQI